MYKYIEFRCFLSTRLSLGSYFHSFLFGPTSFWTSAPMTAASEGLTKSTRVMPPNAGGTACPCARWKMRRNNLPLKRSKQKSAGSVEFGVWVVIFGDFLKGVVGRCEFLCYYSRCRQWVGRECRISCTLWYNVYIYIYSSTFQGAPINYTLRDG